jgi:hypothetical protein
MQNADMGFQSIDVRSKGSHITEFQSIESKIKDLLSKLEQTQYMETAEERHQYLKAYLNDEINQGNNYQFSFIKFQKNKFQKNKFQRNENKRNTNDIKNIGIYWATCCCPENPIITYLVLCYNLS